MVSLSKKVMTTKLDFKARFVSEFNPGIGFQTRSESSNYHLKRLEVQVARV